VSFFKGLAIGRVVHFVRSPGEHRPAIVTRVIDKETGIVNLNVFRDAEDHGALYPEQGASAIATVEYGIPGTDGAPTGTWHWPERED
jgi:hypothetical protein